MYADANVRQEKEENNWINAKTIFYFRDSRYMQEKLATGQILLFRFVSVSLQMMCSGGRWDRHQSEKYDWKDLLHAWHP